MVSRKVCVWRFAKAPLMTRGPTDRYRSAALRAERYTFLRNATMELVEHRLVEAVTDAVSRRALDLSARVIDVFDRKVEFVFVSFGVAAIFAAAVVSTRSNLTPCSSMKNGYTRSFSKSAAVIDVLRSYTLAHTTLPWCRRRSAGRGAWAASENVQAQLAHLEGLAARQPVLMVWEDAPWSDPFTREIL
jgi:hypothetical protein